MRTDIKVVVLWQEEQSWIRRKVLVWAYKKRLCIYCCIFIGKCFDSHFGWLAETWLQSWPGVSELEMSDLPWFNVDEGIQSLSETGRLKWICHLKPTHPDWEGSKDRDFTMCKRHIVRGALESWKRSMVTIPWGQTSVRTAVPELEA